MMGPGQQKVVKVSGIKSGFCYRQGCVGSATHPQITVCKHSPLCHPQMWVKDLLCKEKDVFERHPEVLLSSLGQSLLKMDWRNLFVDVKSSMLKRRGTIQKNLSSQWHGAILVPLALVAYKSVKANINAVKKRQDS